MFSGLTIPFLIQAINQQGSIDANWVLGGITTLFLFLFWRMFNRLEKGQESLNAIVALHNTKLQLHESYIEEMDEDIREVKTRIK